VVQLHREIERIHRTGAELVVVGNGAPHFIAGFRDLTGYRGQLYTDPSLESYRAASLKHGVSTFFHPKVVFNAVRAISKGHLQGTTKGDPAQQGGTLVIRPPGRVIFHHVSQTAGDHAELDSIVAALAR
jgi:hypothetical protein